MAGGRGGWIEVVAPDRYLYAVEQMPWPGPLFADGIQRSRRSRLLRMGGWVFSTRNHQEPNSLRLALRGPMATVTDEHERRQVRS